MGAVASQITSLTIVYSTVDSDADQRKHQSSASLAFVWECEFPAQCPVTRKMFPFDDVIMCRRFYSTDFHYVRKEFQDLSTLRYVAVSISSWDKMAARLPTTESTDLCGIHWFLLCFDWVATSILMSFYLMVWLYLDSFVITVFQSWF